MHIYIYIYIYIAISISLSLSLKGVFTSEDQGNALRQDVALFIGCKNRVFINHSSGPDDHPFSLKDLVLQAASWSRNFF